MSSEMDGIRDAETRHEVERFTTDVGKMGLTAAAAAALATPVVGIVGVSVIAAKSIADKCRRERERRGG